MLLRAIPIVVSSGLVLAACGGGSSTRVVAEQPAPAAAPAAPAGADTPAAPASAAAPAAAAVPAPAAKGSVAAPAGKAPAGKKSTAHAAAGSPAKAAAPAAAVAAPRGESTAQAAANQKIFDEKNGITDIGVTKDAIRLGTVNMHGMALGSVLVTPIVNGIKATLASINDRGGVLGRRVNIIDCDDGPGEVSRSKACIKKLVGQDKVFALLGYSSWASASVHDDLKEYQIPAVGVWAYSQTEWQDPFMFPTHMSMIHEAMAGAHWAANVVKPATYGLICLTSPEMQLACNSVQKIMDAGGAKMVKRADVSISETSMSSYVLAFRAANPEHIIHYVINPATMAKFMVEAAQQGYYPPKGISGNHLATEVLGSIFGQWPTGRYWTNTTYKLWGNEFIATMTKYAAGNRGINHHIVQAVYVGALDFARAAKAVGPNLTRQRLMAQLSNGDVYPADASLDQRFSWRASERNGDNWDHNMGQGREFMYKYGSTNTVSNPDGSPNGWTPDPDQFVIYTWK
jgi:ABC-type branched-subunit amino acid transport system substrate-binding protein